MNKIKEHGLQLSIIISLLMGPIVAAAQHTGVNIKPKVYDPAQKSPFDWDPTYALDVNGALGVELFQNGNTTNYPYYRYLKFMPNIRSVLTVDADVTYRFILGQSDNSATIGGELCQTSPLDVMYSTGMIRGSSSSSPGQWQNIKVGLNGAARLDFVGEVDIAGQKVRACFSVLCERGRAPFPLTGFSAASNGYIITFANQHTNGSFDIVFIKPGGGSASFSFGINYVSGSLNAGQFYYLNISNGQGVEGTFISSGTYTAKNEQ